MTYKTRLTILMVSPFFRPNIGGVETHLSDLTNYLRNNGHKVFVVTYQPLTVKAKAPSAEKRRNLEIRRIRWFGYNWFYKLEPYPPLELLYLAPALLLYSFFFMLRHREIDVVHTHGFVASFVGKLLKLVLRKPVVASVHTTYSLDKRPILGRIFAWILSSFDRVFVVSENVKYELMRYGLDQKKVVVFTYWADHEVFRPLDKEECHKMVGWDNKFVVLFVGRLIEIKGAHVLVRAAKMVDENIHFAFITTGTCEDFLKMVGGKLSRNIIYVGSVDYGRLNIYYNAADVLAVPSQHVEGFARVSMEAMLCGTPVLASKVGLLPEVVSQDVGELIDPPTPEEFAKRITYYYLNREELMALSQNCVKYARKCFTIDNAKVIESACLVKK
jgi:glycosyltransferase involved in cell wall biosynthesis